QKATNYYGNEKNRKEQKRTEKKSTQVPRGHANASPPKTYRREGTTPTEKRVPLALLLTFSSN
ncbi:MAG: hypothetical protein KBT66_05435, partial [Amphritea sp.]|nr:hypothetical protein [Amphritea sp.]